MGIEVIAQTSTLPPLSPTLDKQVQIEKQVGALYVRFAHAFGADPELRAFWSSMALEEGGHAALLRALNNGALAGVTQVMPVEIPVHVVESLAQRVAGYLQRADQEITLDEALRIAWEIETSELDILWELVVSASNLVQLGFPTSMQENDMQHMLRLQEMIQKYATDEQLRNDVKRLQERRRTIEQMKCL